jgi:AraC family transcriptional activator of pobA
LSDKEKSIVKSIFHAIQDKLGQRIEGFSQNVIINQIELLLSYRERFYERQFITRKPVNNDLLTRMEQLSGAYFMRTKHWQKASPLFSM